MPWASGAVVTLQGYDIPFGPRLVINRQQQLAVSSAAVPVPYSDGEGFEPPGDQPPDFKSGALNRSANRP